MLNLSNLKPIQEALSPEVQQLLSQFNDIILPNPVGWWPPSIAMLTFILLMLMVTLGITFSLFSRHKNNKYRREAKGLFIQALQDATSPKQKIEAANALLKQVAITHYGRQKVASLQGESWLEFLQKTASYIEQPAYLKQYLNAYYQKNFTYDEAELETVLNYLQSWIKGHHK